MESDADTKGSCFRIFKVVLVVVLSLAVFGGVLAVLLSLKKTRINRNFCRKADCKERAMGLKRDMDTSVHPCQHFYNFTCGNYKTERAGLTNFFLTANSVLYRRYLDTVLNDDLKFIPHAENLRTFHNACVNVRTHSSKNNYKKDLQNVLERLQWPPLTKNWNVAARFNWLNLEEKLIKTGFTNSLITFTHIMQEDKSEILVCECCPPSDFTYDLIGLSEEELIKEMTEIVEDMISLVDGDKKLANEIVEIFNKIEKIKKLRVMRKMLFRNTLTLRASDSTRTLGEVEKKLKIDFVKFCISIFPSYMNITKMTRIGFRSDCPLRLINFLKNSNKRPLAGYMLLEGMGDLFWIFIDASRKTNRHRQYKNLLRDESTETKNLECYHLNMQLLPELWNYIYVKTYYSTARKAKVLKMLNLILDEGKALINSSWLSSPSRKVIYNKLSKLKFMVDHDEEFVSDKYIQTTFSNLKFDASQMIKSLMQLRAHSFQRQWEIFILKDEKRIIFQTQSKLTVNAFNHPIYNIILIPTTVIVPLLYSDDFEDSLNFGALGSILAHEIFHTIDYGALMIDDNFNVAPWMNEKDRSLFDEKVSCFVKQYSNYKLTSEFHVDGNLTINENLADSGVLLAYRAYLKWLKTNNVKKLPGLGKYNNRQIFWITFGNIWCEMYNKEYLESVYHRNDVHTVGKFRILGTLSNLEEFSKDFKCPANSYMNPKKKCRLYH